MNCLNRSKPVPDQVTSLLYDKCTFYQQALKKIHPSTFKFAPEESNRPSVIKALLKALKKTDTEHATEEYAEKLFDAMQKIAMTGLHQKTE